MRRRDFITLLVGTTVWPLAARAQQGDRLRRIGVLIPGDENDRVRKTYFSAFTQALADSGWHDGSNVRIVLRWGGDDPNRMRALAQELVGLPPDIILTWGTPATVALRRETQTIPIVFAGVGDPVAQRIVPRLDRPGGNLTGFAVLEASLGGKWLELLSEIVPGREPGGGLVVMADVFAIAHRAPIILAVARNNIPAVYSFSYYARDGGLLSYGTDPVDIARRAATYVDRILRGEKPGDLPVQFATKFEMIVNLKTAKSLGLAVPPSILLRADEVIE